MSLSLEEDKQRQSYETVANSLVRWMLDKNQDLHLFRRQWDGGSGKIFPKE